MVFSVFSFGVVLLLGFGFNFFGLGVQGIGFWGRGFSQNMIGSILFSSSTAAIIINPFVGHFRFFLWQQMGPGAPKERWVRQQGSFTQINRGSIVSRDGICYSLMSLMQDDAVHVQV